MIVRIAGHKTAAIAVNRPARRVGSHPLRRRIHALCVPEATCRRAAIRRVAVAFPAPLTSIRHCSSALPTLSPQSSGNPRLFKACVAELLTFTRA